MTPETILEVVNLLTKVLFAPLLLFCGLSFWAEHRLPHKNLKARMAELKSKLKTVMTTRRIVTQMVAPRDQAELATLTEKPAVSNQWTTAHDGRISRAVTQNSENDQILGG